MPEILFDSAELQEYGQAIVPDRELPMAVPRGLVERIRGEFLEMPGLKLTIEQARRLWNLDESVCREALDWLIAEGFLHQTPSGGFIALPSAARMLKATIPAAQRAYRCPHCQHLNSVPVEIRARMPKGGTTFRCAACAKVVSIPATEASA